MRAKFFILIIDGLVLLAGALWMSTWFVRWAHAPDLRRGTFIAWAAALAWSRYRDESVLVHKARIAYARLANARAQALILSGVAAIAISAGCARAFALQVPMYDVGLFHQIFWSLAHGQGFHSTISGAGNFLRDHFSPALAALTPLFWLTGSSALTLQVLHPLLIWGGVAAWVFWARRELGGAHARTILLVAVLSSALWGNLQWGFHENALGFFAQSWFLALALSAKVSPRTRILLIPLFLLWATAKETLLLNAAFFAVGWGFYRQARGVRAWFPLVATTLGLLTIFYLFETAPHPEDKNYFNRYYAYFGNGLPEVLATLAREPWGVFSRIQNHVGFGAIFSYIGWVLLPWLGLPLLGIKFHARAAWLMLGLVPSLLSVLLASYSPLRFTHYHYHLELIPLCAFLSLLALRSWPTGNALIPLSRFAFLWVFSQAILLSNEPIAELVANVKDASNTLAVTSLIQSIPADQSVLAHELAGTWIASRLQVARFPENYKLNQCPDWLVLREENLAPGGLDFLQDCLRGKSLAPQWSRAGWVGIRP